jgi:hypothetical protein
VHNKGAITLSNHPWGEEERSFEKMGFAFLKHPKIVKENICWVRCTPITLKKDQ